MAMSAEESNSNRRRVAVAVVSWIAAIVLSAVLLDVPVARWAQSHGLQRWLEGSRTAAVLKSPGDYWFTVAIALVAAAVYTKGPRWRVATWMLFCGIVSGVNQPAKWLVGRSRPFRVLDSKRVVELNPFHFQPLYDGFRGLFGTTNLCFPSGHTTLAFANAAGLAILFPRYRWVFYGVASLTAAERFLEVAHYVSDNVAAAALGIGVVHLLGSALFVRTDEGRKFYQMKLPPDNVGLIEANL